jgi:putative membrane protein
MRTLCMFVLYARSVLLATHLVVGLVALLHVYFLVLEMFLWATPFGQRTFGRSREEQEQTKALAQNQGLYNGFLAAGLAWSFFAPAELVVSLRVFFLGCVIVAGVFGAATASRKILFVQALPAAAALALVLLSR